MQLLVVLSYLDKIKIIHRDLNPTNIMIPSNGMYLKLVDFGLATQLTQTYIN